jgi:hypothetical protein
MERRRRKSGVRVATGLVEPSGLNARLGVQPTRLGSAPSGILAGTARGGGATTPIEMMYFRASSTVMLNGCTLSRRIIRKKPEVGLGVVGT